MDLLKEAGWPVWFVLPLGTLTLMHAVRHLRGDGALGRVVGAGVATLIAGLFATVLGVQLSFGSIPQLPNPHEMHWIALVGVKEALYNFDVAAAFALVATLIVTYGPRRRAVASAG